MNAAKPEWRKLTEVNLGKSGEELALRFLRKQGYEIIRQNYRTPKGEIDLIARSDTTLIFIEVKTRRSKKFGSPEEAVDRTKQNRIRSIAEYFISQYQLFGHDCRFDIVSVFQEGNSIRIKHIQNAFY
jgi:putative endonuclease